MMTLGFTIFGFVAGAAIAHHANRLVIMDLKMMLKNMGRELMREHMKEVHRG